MIGSVYIHKTTDMGEYRWRYLVFVETEDQEIICVAKTYGQTWVTVIDETERVSPLGEYSHNVGFKKAPKWIADCFKVL